MSPEQIGLYVADLALRGLLVDPDVLDVVRNDTAPTRPLIVRGPKSGGNNAFSSAYFE